MPDTLDTTAEHEDEELQVPDEITPYKYTITSYGADYPVDSLVKRMKSGDIYIPPFQRNYVWDLRKASRFIESLLLGLPVPGIFLSREKTQKLLVIDGQQRLRTLQFFYDGLFMGDRSFGLKDVQDEFEGCTYESLPDEDRRRLDDSIIHLTIMTQDEPSEDNSSILYIFERLNTGGLQLSSQEIRGCMYHGPFNDLLQELNKNESWRRVFGKVNRRKRDEELILRFLSLYFEFDDYARPMKIFLNRFMHRNRSLERHNEGEITQVFSRTVETVDNGMGQNAFRPRGRLNAAAAEAVMVGIARMLDSGTVPSPEDLTAKMARLFGDQEFLDACLTNTTDVESVRVRVDAAVSCFLDVP